MRPNFTIDATGTARVLRKPKLVRALNADERARVRRSRAWAARMSARIAVASSIEELMQVMAEVESRTGL